MYILFFDAFVLKKMFRDYSYVNMVSPIVAPPYQILASYVRKIPCEFELLWRKKKNSHR
jgi:hypothetical protein